MRLLHEHLGMSEDWFFQVIDPSQVVSIGAARWAKALVDNSSLWEATTQRQTLKEARDEL